MNILIIGNGFDLEHKLPTSYRDFLDFCLSVNKLYYEICHIEQSGLGYR